MLRKCLKTLIPSFVEVDGKGTTRDPHRFRVASGE
jgi:hypothetical protein